ncbi:nitroreductase family deazaflavin-dependent oxidoreductase [Agromyces neolithicus]|uniref:Nitroreductase family deazaflavin-dependent oxidoreductase n=1 Tax=Agromyces neolithicus TaxID=269420 RepID=A0ABN2MCP3_9MICO
MDLAARMLKTRWIVRLPIGIYRAGFGFVFGGRLLMLEHLGRSSKKWRQVVLEVADREDRDTVVIASGFGRHAQWYRNLEADPRCIVSVGAIQRRRARAELLGEDESRRLLGRYAARHPAAWKMLDQAIRDATGEADPYIPMVRLRLEPA